MTAYPLEASVRSVGRLAIIELSGELDGSAEEPLTAAYALAEERDPAAILLSFGEVGYINSKGIALIVVLLSRARKADRRLLACGLSDHYREIFEITRLSEYITVCADEEGAVAEVGLGGEGGQGMPDQQKVEAL